MWQVNQRKKKSILHVDDVNPRRKRYYGKLKPIHYQSAYGSNQFDSVVSCVPQAVNDVNLDGWRITQSDWHYELGQPAGLTGDGWLGFGGRQGEAWIRFRISQLGYLRWTNKVWQDIGGAVNYNRTNFSTEIRQTRIGENEYCNHAFTSTWTDLFTVNGEGIDLRIGGDGERLKTDIIIPQSARDWIAANAPPQGNPAQYYFGFLFEFDLDALLRLYHDGVLQVDLSDLTLNGSIELKNLSDELIAFLPIDYLFVNGVRDQTGAYQLTKRIYNDGTYKLFVGLPVSDLATLPAGDLIFDPTTTETIDHNNDDGQEYSGSWYNNGVASNTCYVVHTRDYPGVSWLMDTAIAADSSFTGTGEGAWMSGYQFDASGTVGTVSVFTEDVDPASQSRWSNTHDPSAATKLNTRAGDNIAYSTGRYHGRGETNEVNIGQDIEDLVATAKYGAVAVADRINTWIESQSGGTGTWGGFEDSSHVNNNEFDFELEWTEGGGSEGSSLLTLLGVG